MTISELPEDIQQLAKRNIASQGRPEFEDILGFAFYWTASREGFEFWTLCNHGLFDRARALLTQPKTETE